MKRWLLLLLLLPLFATAQTPVNPQGPKQNQSYIDNVGALWFFVNNTWFPLGGTGFANPMTTAGDIITGGVAGIPTRLGIGGANTVLSVNLSGTGLEYRNLAASSGISGSYSAGLISLVLNENVIQATDANITTINSGRLYKLPNITANRTIDISNPSSFTGKKLNFWNQNTSGFTWSFTGATIVSPAGVDASLIPSNSFVSIESDGTQWVATVSPSGNNGITALTGDVTASGPGSATATLANTAVTPGSYTSTNLTVDSKGRITAASNGSSGGATIYSGDGTLASNRLVTNGGKRLGISDSLYVNVPNNSPGTGGIMYVFGNSIGAGTGATDTLHMYAHLIARYMGYSPRNYSVSGSVLENRSPATPFGGYSMAASTANIPTYVAGTSKLLLFELGVGDWRYAGLNYTPTNYQTDLTSVLNFAISTRGWPASKIVVTGVPFVNTSLYGTTGAGGGTVTQANQLLFIAAGQASCTATGALFFDAYNYMLTRGGNGLVTNDLIHPNNNGHSILAQGIVNLINSTVTRSTQSFAVNGKTEFTSIHVKNPQSSPNDQGAPIGLDSANKIKYLSNLPPNFLINAPYLQNGLTQVGSTIPNTIASNDILLAYLTKITSSFSNTVWNTIQISDAATTGMTFTNNAGAGISNSIFKFIPSVTPASFVTIGRDGGISTGGLGEPTGSPGYVAGDIQFVSTVTGNGNGIGSTVAGSFGKFIPQGLNGHTYITNTWTSGRIKIFMSGGTTGSQVEKINILPSGMLGLNYFVDDGFNMESLNKVRFQGGSYWGRLTDPVAGATSTSTTGGTLAAATYFYKVTGVDVFGNETRPYTEQSKVTTGTTSTVTVSWTAAITGAVSYRIYQGTSSNGEAKYFTAPAGSTSATDIGSGYTAGSPPTVNSTYYAGVSSTGIGSFIGLGLFGSTSGTVSILPQSAAGTYNFNLPTTAGTAGQVLISGGGGATAQSYATAPIVLATITGINAKTTGTTALYTVPAGKTCVVTGVYVRCTAASAISAGPTADVGVSAGDVYANTAMGALTASGKVFQYPVGGVFSSSAAAAVINFNINTAATGTSQTIQVDLIGYLE